MTVMVSDVARPSTPPLLRSREDIELPERIARSVAAMTDTELPTGDFHDWFTARGRANHMRVDRIPLADLKGWSFEPTTGNLVHDTGRFFTVEGLQVRIDDGTYREWQQPIIRQPEVGILGILAKEFKGVLHFLMQAKMEPGNPNLLQLAPTVQATRSNYTRVHEGAAVRYLEYFTHPEHNRVFADVLQSEHGAWFYHKTNRNMIVETAGDVPMHHDFCWLTLGQLGKLLRHDNLVNMDSRTVLACVPFDGHEAYALSSDTELLSWFTAVRSRPRVRVDGVPLAGVSGWTRGAWSIDHVQGQYFSVVAVSVRADSREVSSWTQPLFEPTGVGIVCFLLRRIGGVPHVLAHARVEAGFLDTVELGPTVQCVPSNYANLPPEDHPPFLDIVLSADRARVLYDAVHSEEGGRFLNAENRYMVIDVDQDQPLGALRDYRWVTPGQLTSLVRHSHYLNVHARTMLACLRAITRRV